MPPSLTLTPADCLLELFEGDAFNFVIELTDTDTGDPIDVSGNTFTSQILGLSNELIYDMTIDDTDANIGKIAVAGTAALTSWNGLKWLFRDATADRTYVKGRVSVEAQ
jgi:hypothetical protein